MKRWLFRFGLAASALAALGTVVLVSGIVPVKASSGHWPITAFLLRFAMERSVSTHSIGIEPPPLDDRRLVLAGAGHYHGGCAPCHGAPGERMPRIARAMTPHPPRLSERVAEHDDAALFYIVLHGVKLTGMPAWPAQQREDEVWAVVAFVRRLPGMDASEYARLVRPEPVRPDESPPDAAPELVAGVCARCHGADGLGRGEGAFPRLAGQRREYLEDALEAYARGERHSGFMEPIAAELDSREIAELAGWYAQQPRAAAGVGGGADALGARIAESGIPERRVPACGDCHGPGHPAYPILEGQHAPYLEQQLELWTRGERGGGELAEVMRIAVAHGLEQGEIRAVARFYAGR